MLVIIPSVFAENQSSAELFSGDTSTAIIENDSAKPAESKKNITLILGRAIDALPNSENRWMAALLEAMFEFKASAFKKFNIVDHDSLVTVLPEHVDFSKNLTESQYLDIAKKLKADYVGVQRFELQTRQKSFFYYLEVYSVKDRQIETTIERNFKLNTFGTEMDEIFLEMLKNFKIEIPTELTRFVRLPAVSSELKSLKQLGECIIRDRFAKNIDSLALANEYIKICEKDQSMMVAYYRTGSFLEAMQKNSDAAEAYNVLFMAIPEYYPVYLPLARNYRKSNRFEDALRITTLGTQRGIRDPDLISEKAYSLQGLGKKMEAKEVYQDILKNDPDDPNALLYFAKLNNDAGKPDEALKYSSRLLKLKKNTGNALIEYGRSQMLLSKNEEAITSFSEASRYLPNDHEPDLYLGDIYYSLNKFSTALSKYELVIEKKPDNIDAYLKASSASQKAGDNKKAYELLKRIEPKYSNHGTLQRELGVLGLINGDSSKAKIHLEASVRAGTADERVNLSLGWIYIRSGEYDRAFSMFSKAISKTENKSQCNLGIAIVYIKRGEISSALDRIKEVASADLNISGVNRMLGDALLSKGEKENALAFYKKESAFAKNDTSLQSQIAALSYEKSAASVSRNEYLNLTGMGAGGAFAFFRLTVLSLRLKDKAGAMKYLAKAQSFGDADAQTWFEIAQEFGSLGDLSQSLKAYEKCVAKDQSKEAAWVALSEGFQKLGKDSAAAEAHMKLFSINNAKYKSNLMTAGKIYEKSGRNADAKRAYSLFLQKQSNNPEISIRLAHLEFKDKNFNEVIRLLQGVSPSLINTDEADILAESYIGTNQFSKALPHLEYILRNNPKDLRAIELTAKMHEKNNNFEDAAAMFRKYLSLKGRHQEYAFHIAELYEKQGKTDDAISQLLSNSKIYPTDFRNFDHLARYYYKIKSWNSAIQYLNRALQFSEASNELRGMLASAQAEKGLKADAILNYKKFLSKTENDSVAWFTLGSLYFSSNQYREAADALQRASSMMSRNTELFNMLGVAYFKIGDLANAITPFIKAREGNKKDVKLIQMLAQCYRKTKNSKNLVLLLKEWVELDNSNFEIRQELATLLTEESRPQDAAPVLEDALRIKSCDVDMRLRLVKIYESLGKDDLVFSHLRSALQCSPKNSDITYKLALHLKAKNDMENAEEYLRKTISLSPSHLEAKYILGTYLNSKKKYSEAASFLNQIVAAKPGQDDYRIALTESQYLLGKYADARRTIRPVAMRDNPKAEVLRWAGLTYRALGYVDTAKQILESAVGSDQSCRECFLALGDIFFDEADFKMAAKYFQSAFDAGEYNQKAAMKLARSYHRLGETESAQRLYEMILSKDAQIGEALYRLTHYLLEDNQLRSAKDILVRNAYKKHGWYYLAEAEISEADKNYSAAMNSYNKALKFLPEAPEVQTGIGRINLAQKKYSAAIMNFGLAMAGDPENVQMMLDLGKAYEGAREYENAMEMYKEIVQRQQDNSEVYYCMARIYSKKRDHSRAIQSLKEGIRFSKNNPALHYALGQEFRAMKMNDNAIQAYSKAVKLDSERYKDAYKHIGNLYYVKKDIKKAKKNYELYISVGGNDPKVLKLIRKMQ